MGGAMSTLVDLQDKIDAYVEGKDPEKPGIKLLTEIKNAFTDIRSEIAEKDAELGKLRLAVQQPAAPSDDE